MGRIHVAPLDEDVYDTLEAEPEAYAALESEGYRPEIDEIYQTIHHKPDDENSSHLVFQATALAEPFDPDTTDAADDRVEIWICDCRGYYYTHMSDSDGNVLPPARIDEASDDHVQAVKRFAKADRAVDDQQVTLQ